MPSSLTSRRPAAALAAGLLAATVWLPVTAHADVAPSAELDQAVITAGESTVLRGTAEPGTTVSLLGASRPETSYAVVDQVTSGDDGAFSFVVAPTTNSLYSVATRSGDGSEQTSEARSLRVRRAVQLDPVVVDGDRVTVTGRILPRVIAPVSVVFERDGVRTVEAGARADLRSGFRATFTSDRRGAFLVSVTVPASTDNLAGESPAQQVVVRPAAAVPAQG